MDAVRATTSAAAVALFAACCVLPIVWLLLTPAVAGNWGVYQDAILDARQLGLLVNSVRIAGGAALLSAVVGAPLGFLLARTDVPFRNGVRLALVIPVLLPTYALGLAWVYFGGRAGIAARVFGVDVLSAATYSAAGAAIVLGLALYPIPMLATEAAARRVESRLEEAALLVAPPRRVLARITLPLLWPGLTSSILLVFVLALSDYAVPNLLRQRVYTTEVFTAFAALYDVSRAAAVSLPLVVIAVLVAMSVNRSGRGLLTGRFSSSVGLGFGRLPAAAGVALASVFGCAVVLPVGILAAQTAGPRVVQQAIARSGATIIETMLLAGIAATVVVTAAVVLGHRRARAVHAGAKWFDVALVALLAMPGTVVGVALIDIWNRGGWAGGVYRSAAILPIAYTARFMPVAILIVAAFARQVAKSGEEAAATSGAAWLRTMRRIVVPQLTTGLVTAWVIVFALAFGEVSAAVLVAPPGHAPYPVDVFTLIANAPAEQVAALGLLHMGVIVCSFVGGGWLLARTRRIPRATR